MHVCVLRALKPNHLSVGVSSSSSYFSFGRFHNLCSVSVTPGWLCGLHSRLFHIKHEGLTILLLHRLVLWWLLGIYLVPLISCEINKVSLHFQYGKDFDAIQSFIQQKQRKKDPNCSVKTKDQVRHFYYRTWHKIAKVISLDGVDGRWDRGLCIWHFFTDLTNENVLLLAIHTLSLIIAICWYI